MFVTQKCYNTFPLKGGKGVFMYLYLYLYLLWRYFALPSVTCVTERYRALQKTLQALQFVTENVTLVFFLCGIMCKDVVLCSEDDTW